MATDNEVVHTERGFDRLVNFTDAVVAIAATLLILPLIERLSDALSTEGGTSQLLSKETSQQFFAFFVTFWVMTIFWRQHHAAFERLKDYSPGLISLTFLWLFAMIFLAYPSGYLGEPDANVWSMYFGALAIISLFSVAISAYASKHPELQVDPASASNQPDYWSLIYPVTFGFGALIAQVPAFTDGVFWFFLVIPVIGIIYSRKAPPPPKHTRRGFDRLVNFSDAVIAIAITLLILPLIDLVTSDRGDGEKFTIDQQTIQKLVAFVITFWMMSRQWLANHRTFEKIKDYSQTLMTLTFCWLVLMVFLAFPSGIVGAGSLGPTAAGLAYAFALGWGTLALIAVFTALIQTYASRNPDLLTDRNTRISARQSLYFVLLYLVMCMGSLAMGYFGAGDSVENLLFLLVLIPVIKRSTEGQQSHGRQKHQSP